MSMLIERARRWGEERNRKWLSRGLQMGRSEGRVEGKREMVRRLVGRRFGERAADDFDPVLADVSDSGVLLVPIAAQTFACESVAELAEWVRRQEKSQTMMLIERARGRDEELDREWLEMGLEKGRREGREVGRLEGERELVRRLVARRFGRGAANDIVPLLASVSDSDRFDRDRRHGVQMRDTCGAGRMDVREWGGGVTVVSGRLP